MTDTDRKKKKGIKTNQRFEMHLNGYRWLRRHSLDISVHREFLSKREREREKENIYLSIYVTILEWVSVCLYSLCLSHPFSVWRYTI